MIQLITMISNDILPYVDEEFSMDINSFLLEIQTRNPKSLFEQILKEDFPLREKKIVAKCITSLFLDYSAIDYAETLAFLFNVDITLIYDWSFRMVLKDRNVGKK